MAAGSPRPGRTPLGTTGAFTRDGNFTRSNMRFVMGDDGAYFPCLTWRAGLVTPSSPASIKIVSSAFCGPK